MVTLTETGTHSPVDARVGGYCAGEQELAVAMARSAAGMLVIMDRGFPGVALWKAYTQARAHLLIRARSSVARRPVQVLGDGTYLARMNLAGQKGAHPGGVLVRVIEYRVDGGEVIRLLTDLMDPVAFPAGELAALYHQRWESESSFRQVKTFQRGPQEILRSADPELVRQEIWAHLAVRHCLTRIIMRLAGQERIDPDRIFFIKVLKHVRRSVIRQSAADISADQAGYGDAGGEGPPQARQRRQAPAGGRQAPQAPGLEVLLPHGRPGPPSYPPGGRQGAHHPDSSQLTSNGIGSEGHDGDVDDRGLDPETHARLRVEAARHGRSMEAEVRAILQDRLMPSAGERGLGSRIRARFEGLEGDLELPDRSGDLPRAAEFDL